MTEKILLTHVSFSFYIRFFFSNWSTRFTHLIVAGLMYIIVLIILPYCQVAVLQCLLVVESVLIRSYIHVKEKMRKGPKE
ncbi:hypothetical protein HanPSC8_Chr01g0037151 [Helianthus annuus]|nr:hypothetical protein HanPSC8_Chr01g0037151 [Helianthus annuus]